MRIENHPRITVCSRYRVSFCSKCDGSLIKSCTETPVERVEQWNVAMDASSRSDGDNWESMILLHKRTTLNGVCAGIYPNSKIKTDFL